MAIRIVFAVFVLLLVMPLAAEAGHDVLLSMPEPPEGMSVSKQALRVEDEIVGYHVQLSDDQGVSKVIVQIETSYDRSKKESRVAGLKGYVNGIANGLKNSGFKLVSNQVPNLKDTDFTKPLQVEMEFAKDDETRLFVRQFIFFTSKGFNVQVVSSDERELDELSAWARLIRPAQGVKELASTSAEIDATDKPAKRR